MADEVVEEHASFAVSSTGVTRHSTVGIVRLLLKDPGKCIHKSGTDLKDANIIIFILLNV
jgi:hypothetical protein